tara:strand:- start:27721 stop:28251 length:531 start_codon:yes stop_codon:yes gene_type:complete
MTVNSFRIKPASESEYAILGGLLLEPALFSGIKEKLCAADFYYKEHQKIFTAISELYKKHGSFDIPMLIDKLNYENPENNDRLYIMANECVSTANINAHTDIVREKSVQRQLIECAGEMVNLEKVPVSQKDLLVHYLQETAAEISSADMTKEYLNMLLVEVSKAFISTLIDLEHRE